MEVRWDNIVQVKKSSDGGGGWVGVVGGHISGASVIHFWPLYNNTRHTHHLALLWATDIVVCVSSTQA